MQNIFVESGKKIDLGFKIFESDMRRISQLCIEQIHKLGAGVSYQQFIIKLENGITARTSEIDQVFVDDNLGANKIIMLDVLTSDKPITSVVNGVSGNDSQTISIQFNDIQSENNNSTNPIKYKVRGSSRDWVMVSSSLIDERLIKLKRSKIKVSTLTLIKLILPLLMLFFVFVFASSGITEKDSIQEKLPSIENTYKKGGYNSVGDLILALERAKIKHQAFAIHSNLIYIPLGLVILIMMAVDFKIFSFFKLYPLYNFCWGDYLEEFNRIEKRRKLVISLLVGTIVLGIIVNLLSSAIWQKFGF